MYFLGISGLVLGLSLLSSARGDFLVTFLSEEGLFHGLDLGDILGLKWLFECMTGLKFLIVFVVVHLRPDSGDVGLLSGSEELFAEDSSPAN